TLAPTCPAAGLKPAMTGATRIAAGDEPTKRLAAATTTRVAAAQPGRLANLRRRVLLSMPRITLFSFWVEMPLRLSARRDRRDVDALGRAGSSEREDEVDPHAAGDGDRADVVPDQALARRLAVGRMRRADPVAAVAPRGEDDRGVEGPSV